MNSVRLLTLFFALTINTSALANVSLSGTIETFHTGLNQGQSLETILRRELGDHYSEAQTVLSAAIASTPGDVLEIVRIAIDEGVLAEDIAAQCETMLNQRQLVDLIRVALGERIDPEPIIRRCFVYIPNSQISDLLALAINNSTPGEIERVIAAAFDSLIDDVGDPFAMVKEGILRSNAFTVEGIEYAEEIDDLVTEIRLQDVLEVVVTEEGNDIDEVADADSPPPGGSEGGFEPPMSDS